MEGAAPELLVSPLLRSAGFPHAFTTRRGGRSTGPYASINLGRGVDDDPVTVQANRETVLHSLGLDPRRHVEAAQVHGSVLAVVGRQEAGRSIPEADGLASVEPGTVLAVHAADCVTILLADPETRAVAAVHAGWRGTAAGVAGKAVGLMAERFRVRPDRLLAAIGPSIGACHYEVDGPVMEAFRPWPWWDQVAAPNRDGRWQLDLRSANRIQLLDRGMRADHVEIIDLCTYHHPDLFYSHRRDRLTGRMAAIIGVPDGRPRPLTPDG